MKEMTADRLKAVIEFNKKMVGRKVFIVSENCFGLCTEVLDEETYGINIRGQNRRVSIFDVRSVDE